MITPKAKAMAEKDARIAKLESDLSGCSQANIEEIGKLEVKHRAEIEAMMEELEKYKSVYPCPECGGQIQIAKPDWQAFKQKYGVEK